MSVAVYKIKSELSQVTRKQTDAWLAAVEKELGEPMHEVGMEEYASLPFGLIFVASGGSEGIFLRQYEKISDRPCYLLTSGQSNSLAASMEILTYLQQRGKKGEILHGSAADVARRIRALSRAGRALSRLNGMKLGCAGAPSDWLIASPAGDAAYRAKLGLSVEEIPMGEVLAEYERKTYEQNEWTELLFRQGYDRSELEKALWVYGAFSRIVKARGLSGLTVRCFDLLDTVKTTGCLGLAILNAQGVYGGCEGDVPSLVSMAILGEASQKPVFLCNPSRIDTEKGEMVLAHCTLPLNMPESIRLTTHYESGIGVAVAGHVPQETCTIFKTNAALDRYFAKRGEIVANLCEDVLCRTQIKLRLDDFSYFLKAPLQNHHLVCLGDHTDALQALFEQLA